MLLPSLQQTTVRRPTELFRFRPAMTTHHPPYPPVPDWPLPLLGWADRLIHQIQPWLRVTTAGSHHRVVQRHERDAEPGSYHLLNLRAREALAVAQVGSS